MKIGQREKSSVLLIIYQDLHTSNMHEEIRKKQDFFAIFY